MSDKYEQKRLRQEYRWLYKKLLNLFATYDPLSLCAMGAPLDEYGGEVIRILSKIQDIYSSAALSEAMFEVFACNFPNKVIQGFPKERFDVMAQEFWRAYRRWQVEEERVRRTARFYVAGSFVEELD